MALTNWLIERFPRGFYAGPARKLFLWLYNHLSIGAWIRAWARNELRLADIEKTPEVFAEMYQLGGVLVGVTLVTLIGFLPRSLATVLASAALYRPFEIFLFAVNWLLVDRSKIHSYTRSVVLFSVNIVEVVLFYAAAYLGLGCVVGPNAALTALYSSLRTSVTIGPTKTEELPNSLCCGGALMTQIALSYFLALAVLAYVVGALTKREEVSKR